MSETTPVGSSRRGAALAVLAMVVLIGGLIGLRWAADRPVPTAAAILPTPSAPPTATPSPSPPPTSTPPPTTTPTAAPAPTAQPTPQPTPRPTEGHAPVRVLTSHEFQAVFLSRLFVGQTVVVDGRIDPIPAEQIGQESDLLNCGGNDSCLYGALAGATPNGGTRPLLVWARRINTPLGPDDVAERYYWPSKARAELPVTGELVLHIDTTYSVEYLGRAVVDAAGDIWEPSSVATMNKRAPELDQVVLVDGWLGQSSIRVECTPEEPASPLPRHFCGAQAWLSDHPAIGDASEMLGVQPDAYLTFVPPFQREQRGDEYVPTPALTAVGLRLERDGCDEPPCPSWTVLARITPQPDVAAAVDQPAPTAVPDDGWVEIAAQNGRSAEWSPNGRWLLVSLFREVVLVDARTGAAVQRWAFDAGHFGRGAIWIDDRRFLGFNQPLDAALAHDGLAPAVMGQVGRQRLVPISVPVAYEELDVPFIDPLAGGDGAVAFNTTRMGESACGYDGCFAYRVWSPNGTSKEHAGMPIAWSPAGDRLAVIRNDPPSPHRGAGAGFAGYSGWLDVVSWPGLRTVFADRRVIVHQDSAFDPTGHLLASMVGPAKVVNLDTGRVTNVDAAGWPPLWDAWGNLVASNDDGDVLAIDLGGELVSQWVGAGHRIVGTADGTTQVAMLDDAMRSAGAPLIFTLIRDRDTTQFALPPQEPDSIFWDQAVSPDGRAFFVWVRHYNTTNGQLLFRRLP